MWHYCQHHWEGRGNRFLFCQGAGKPGKGDLTGASTNSGLSLRERKGDPCSWLEAVVHGTRSSNPPLPGQKMQAVGKVRDLGMKHQKFQQAQKINNRGLFQRQDNSP